MNENEQTDTHAEHAPSPVFFYDLRPEDFRAANLHARRRLLRKAIPSWAATLYISIIILASLLTSIFISGVAARHGGIEAGLLYASLLLYLIIFFTIGFWRRFVNSRADRAVIAGSCMRCGGKRLALDNCYLHLSDDLSETRIPMQAVRELSILQDIIILYLDQEAHIIVPRRIFDSPTAEKEFVSLLQDGGHAAWSDNKVCREPAGELKSGPVFADSGRNSRSQVSKVAHGVLTNLRCGFRLAFFRKVSADRLEATPGAFAALAIFDIILHFLISVARVGPEGHFTFYPFSSAVFHIPLMLLAGLCIARLAQRRELALALPVSWLSIGIPLDLFAAFFNVMLENGTTANLDSFFQNYHFYAFYGWWTLAALKAAMGMTGSTGTRRIGAAALLAALIVVPLWETQRGELWQEAYDNSDDTNISAAAGEEAFYRQPSLLDDSLAKLRHGRKGIGNVYFVGFAGYGNQDVFKKEMEVVRLLFLDRFDTGGHSLVMINNPGTVLKYPIATATALRRTLKRVGEVMNRDRDILVLYLTSHGSRDHRLSVDLWPLELRQIDPAMLRKMLDDSGIRWRVIVVSACYSGGFIEPLKDKGTLVMTASDATSNSFGCSNDSDFTWFGEALFNEELRHTFSFTTAFQRASASIRKREVKEGDEPSNPQIFEGRDIIPVLSRLEARLEKRELLRKHKIEHAELAMSQ